MSTSLTTKRTLRPVLRSRVQRGVVLGVALAASAVLAACSSSGGSKTNTSSAPAGGGSTAAAASSGGSSGGGDGLMNPGTLTVGMNLQFKPEMYLDNGKPAGYDVDLLNELAKSLNVKLDIKNLDFNGLIPGLQSKKFDIVSVGLTPNPEREKVIDFTRSYVPYASILAVKGDYSGPETIDAFNKSGVTITALQGSSDETLAKSTFPKATVQGLADQNATLLQVRTGRASGAVLEDYLLAQYLKSNAGTLRQAKLAKPLSLSYGSWGVQKGNKTLIDKLNGFLCTAQNDGTLAKLYKQDFGATIPAMPGGC